MLELGKIDIDADVPAIMADYEVLDLAEELWVWRFKNTSDALGIWLGGINAIMCSSDPNQVLKHVKRSGKVTNQGTPIKKGLLFRVTLRQILSKQNAAIYTSYPHDYRLILRSPGDTP